MEHVNGLTGVYANYEIVRGEKTYTISSPVFSEIGHLRLFLRGVQNRYLVSKVQIVNSKSEVNSKKSA